MKSTVVLILLTFEQSMLAKGTTCKTSYHGFSTQVSPLEHFVEELGFEHLPSLVGLG